VRPMLDVAWAPLLGAFSVLFEEYHEGARGPRPGPAAVPGRARPGPNARVAARRRGGRGGGREGLMLSTAVWLAQAFTLTESGVTRLTHGGIDQWWHRVAMRVRRLQRGCTPACSAARPERARRARPLRPCQTLRCGKWMVQARR